MKKFMLGCRFTFEAHAKTVIGKVTKCSLKPADDMMTCAYLWLIFIKTSLKLFQEPQKLLISWFFFKILSDVRSEIHLVRLNIVSTGQAVRS